MSGLLMERPNGIENVTCKAFIRAILSFSQLPEEPPWGKLQMESAKPSPRAPLCQDCKAVFAGSPHRQEVPGACAGSTLLCRESRALSNRFLHSKFKPEGGVLLVVVEQHRPEHTGGRHTKNGNEP
jgi:hypothetical protein